MDLPHCLNSTVEQPLLIDRGDERHLIVKDAELNQYVYCKGLQNQNKTMPKTTTSLVNSFKIGSLDLYNEMGQI
ncbi:hypothetical protein STEG23_008699 [Scotinomys teguina]